MYSSLIAFFLVSITVSFLCSLWEAVLLSISPSYMQIKLNEGEGLGKTLQRFKENIDKPLAGILTMNTIAHTVGAIGVGQQATIIWQDSHPLITGLAVPAVMTTAILILSEVIPKTIGATNWRVLAPFTVRSLDILLTILAPIIWLCQMVTGIFNSNKESSVFSRSDFLAMAQIGKQEGELSEVENRFVQSLMNFKNHKARDVMTPRTVMTSAPQDMTFNKFYDVQDELIFSRIPLRESHDSEVIVGYVLKDHVLEHIIDGDGDRVLRELKRDILVVQENHSILRLFNDLMERREHIALVVDDFGNMIGLITMEDIVETLLGAEIVDETDKFVDLQDVAKKKWKNRYKEKRVGNSVFHTTQE